MLTIEVLFFDGCPSWKTGLANLETALDELDAPVKVKLIQVEDPDLAQQERFLGSPSFRANGVDLWPEQREQYALSCRMYATPAGLRGAPTVEMLKEKLCPLLEQPAA